MNYLLYKEKLNPQYLAVFEKIECYLEATYVDDGTREEQCSELLDCLLSAQEAGKTVESVVGTDIQAFCKNFCSGYGWKNYLWRFLEMLQLWSVLILLFSVLSLFAVMRELPLAEALQEPDNGFLVPMLGGLCIGLFSNFLTKKLMFRMKKLSLFVLKEVTGVVLIAAVVLLRRFMPDGWLRFPLWITLLACIVYLIVYRFVSRKHREMHGDYRISFGQLFAEEIESTLDEDMRAEFAKDNEKRAKKRKPLRTWEEFLAHVAKRCDNMEKKWFYFCPPVFLVVGIVFGICAAGGTAELLAELGEVLRVIAIALAVTCPILYGFWKLSSKTASLYRAWLSTNPQEFPTAAELTEPANHTPHQAAH